jgi:hypothetical protein
MTNEIIERLKYFAQKECWADELYDEGDFTVDDFAGGNVDDAYYGGENAGYTQLAREILDSLKISY